VRYAIEDEEKLDQREGEIYLKDIVIKEEIGGGNFGNALPINYFPDVNGRQGI
jgi:hypothetical protein